jgi:hypothetical protein
MFNEDFLLTMTEVEREAWITFIRLVTKFLANYDPDYVTTSANMLEKFKVLGCLMSLKIHLLNSHLGVFLENLYAMSKKQGKRFHQHIKEMERRYQSRWNVNMTGDYRWTLRYILKFR